MHWRIYTGILLLIIRNTRKGDVIINEHNNLG